MPTISQIPNGQQYPNTPTQTVPPVPSAYGSTVPLNTVRIWEAIKPVQHDTALSSKYAAANTVKQMTHYLDGSGRPLQLVVKKGSPAGKDVVTPVIYDDQGREALKYLPYVSNTTDGNFKASPFTEQSSFYTSTYNPGNNANGEKFFYHKTDFEASPLGRVEKYYAPGNSWTGNNTGITNSNQVNGAADSVRIWNMVMTAGTTPTSAGFYTAGQLHKKITTDERGYSTIEYSDKEGRTILRKVQAVTQAAAGPSGWLNTYYVYDDAGHLRYVIQPKGTDWLKGSNWTFDNTQWRTSTIAKELCYSYEYDGRHRMIVKRLPGSAEIWMVYDALDRVVMVQDSSDRAAGNWRFTQYDGFNRPTVTGIWPVTGDRAYHQNLAKNSTGYPAPAEGAYTLLTQTWYDNYAWVSSSGSGLSSTLITANGITGAAYFYTASNTTFPYPQALATGSSKGLITGSKIRVLGTGSYLYAVNFYDSRGRLIQTHSTNYSGGKDTLTTQYSFSGNPLRILACQQKAGGNPQAYRLLTKMDYDAGGRLTRIIKKAGNSPEVTITENRYDELGRIGQKNIGKVRNSASLNTYTATPLDSLKLDYNIRNWIKGMNKTYVRGETGGTGWFGYELSYDFGFTTSEVSGNISGMRWVSRGDGEQRAYGYTYDVANRLVKANFTQHTGAAWNTSAGVDFSVPAINYDANGNITRLLQKGMVLGSSPLIDSLEYGYAANSNRLNYVTDKVNNAASRLGDFKEVTNNTTQDYWYDGDGNLIKDNNRNIASIRYNSLNLPDSIVVTGKGTIRYVYDAAGNKLSKITTDNAAGRTTRTDYHGLFIYSNDTLQFIMHEEGRIRPHRPNYSDTMYYDYFEKDYLGNVRVVLTDQQQQDVYPAVTLEGSITTDGAPNAVFREKDYYNINAANIVDKSVATGITDYVNNNGNPPYNNNPNSAATANSQKLYKLAATTAGGATGLGITLKVMSGDRINIFGRSYYFQNNTAATNYNIPVLDILTGLVGAPTGATATKGITAAQLNAQSAIANAVAGYLTDPDRNNSTGTVPKASVNYILFDENFKYVAGNFSAVGAANIVKNHYADAQLQNIPVTKNGYLYVYVSNESPVNVFFDNLQVIQTRGPLLEEAHYYPYGLTMAGLSASAARSLTNKYKFNDKELQAGEFSDASGLELYDFSARTYDPQIGRFLQIDPLAEMMRRWSPYQYSFDNPVRYADGTGTMPGDSLNKEEEPLPTIVLPEVVVTAKKETSFWSTVGNVLWEAADYVPFVGSIKEIGVGLYNGDWLQVGMGVVMLGVDIFTAGEGGQLLRIGKNLGKEIIEREIKEVAEREIIEQVGSNFVKKRGGRLGKQSTRDQVDEIATELEKRGYEITGGGNRLPEEYLAPLQKGSRKGSSYPDITATKNGKTIRINTVDTYKSGKATTRELDNAARIRKQRPNDHLILIPKRQ